jgi:hypothetical protein
MVDVMTSNKRLASTSSAVSRRGLVIPRRRFLCNAAASAYLARTLTALSAVADAPPVDPPTQVTHDGYLDWLNAINSNISAFVDLTFDWYSRQLGSPLPPQVNSDPDKIYIAVDQAEQQTISLENSGDIEEGNTMGFDVYCQVNVPISVALETVLFYCGKPIGQRQGDTYPYNDIFSACHLSIRENWGAGNYLSNVSMTGGGIVSDLHDDDTILLRGTPTDGYVLFASFYRPTPGSTTVTEAEIFITMLKSLSDGRTECRQSVRRNGQSYRFFGLDFGRAQYGFNRALFHREQKAVLDSMNELQTTGKIKERR